VSRRTGGREDALLWSSGDKLTEKKSGTIRTSLSLFLTEGSLLTVGRK
jgi:hypothetical protein